MGPEAARRASGVLATDLEGPRGERLRTVEHWLAAAVGLGIGGVARGCDGAELPACGGSALPIAAALRELTADGAPALRRWSPAAPLRVVSGDAQAQWLPAPRGRPGALWVRYRIDFPGSVIGVQEVELELSTPEQFMREVAGARTFTAVERLEQVTEARRRGVGAGLGPGDGLVAGASRWLHGEPLRWPDEAARHKVLDVLGDLGTLGVRPAGTLILDRGGHRLHRLLARVAAGALGASGNRRRRPGH